MPEKDLTQRFTDHQKLNFVLEAKRLAGVELGRFLRSKGISSVELENWHQEMLDGLAEGKPMTRGTKKSLENRIKLLEAENEKLRVINELQKKSQVLREEFAARQEAEKIEKEKLRLLKKGSKKD